MMTRCVCCGSPVIAAIIAGDQPVCYLCCWTLAGMVVL